MSLNFNLRHLEKRSLHLKGEAMATELDLVEIDELIGVIDPVCYDVTVEHMGDNILAQGRLSCTLACRCARCLKPFTQQLDLHRWAVDLPLDGEDKVLITNDCVDLTPFVREDILLAFPQHPLCEPECRGLLGAAHSLQQPDTVETQAREVSSAWAELNKLKL
jgi:uncharacterized metal-binding protein YceD (DUF177 family)